MGLTKSALEGLDGVISAELSYDSAIIIFDGNITTASAIEPYLRRFGLKGKFNLIINHLEHIFKAG